MSSKAISAVAILGFSSLLMVGCDPEKMAGEEAEEPKVEKEEPKDPEPLPPLKLAPEAGDEVAIIETGKGRIIVMFHPDRAPKTVENFKTLAKAGFYEGIKFHRVVPDFMIQGGDPFSKDDAKYEQWGMGGSDESVPDEFNDIAHVRGVLSMANSGQPGSQSSQFFIVQQDSPFLNGKYSAFGRVVSGIEVVDEIVKTPVKEQGSGKVFPSYAVPIKSVTIKTWPLE